MTWGLETIGSLVFLLSAPLYLLYVRSFFDKKLSFRYLIFLVLPLVAMGLSTFLEALPAAIMFILYVMYFVHITRKQVLQETRTRGLALFLNPGKNLIWFRNFGIYQILLSIIIAGHPVISGSTNLMIGLLLVNILLVYLCLLSGASFWEPNKGGQKYAKSSLTPDQKFSILNRLEKLMGEEKTYVDPSISLSDLANKLNTTEHNLSQVLNEQKGQTFAEYIMQYRVDEAKRILRSDPQKHLKIEDIAVQVGYNSKSAFNTAFKRFTRFTPSEFRQLKNVRDYREERLAGRTIRYYGKAPGTFDLYLNQIYMVRNFFKIFTRNLLRNKVFTAINLFGLVIGFTSSLFIYLFISDELSYDQSTPNAQDIYRVAWFDVSPQTRTPHPMAQAMVRDFPEVEKAVTISPWYGSGLSKQKITVKNVEENIQFEEPDFYFVDSTFLEVFGVELINGNAETALKQPGGIILNESMAHKYFGNQDPLGKRLAIGSDEIPVEVVGVVADVPSNSHFHYNFLISYVTLKSMLPEDDFWMTWGDFGHFNYIKLKPGSDPSRLEGKIPEWFLSYNNWNESSRAGLLNGTNKFRLQRITDIHLKSNIRWELEANGNVLYIYILTAAVLFILTIASINYINLTTAKSVERAKEIGIRKTLGALKGHLSFQFLVESVMFCVLAGVVAVLLTWALIPNFNQLSGKTFSGMHFLDWQLILFGTIGILSIGIISGIYPALALAGYRPTEILKGNFAKTRRGNFLSRILVIFQFVISAILISASLIILKQTNFLRDKPLGFEEDYVITIPIKSNSLRERHAVISREIRRTANVIDATAVSNVPGGQFNQNAIWTETNPDNPVTVSEMTFDFNTIKTLNLELGEGREFNNSYALDSAGGSFILNEAAVQQLQLKTPIGTKINWNLEEGDRSGQVVGVLKDFHYKSLHQSIQPLIVDMRRSYPGFLLVRIKNEDIPGTIEQIESIYTQFDTKHDFDYSFLDQSIDELYAAEVRTLNIFGIFSIIALILACLGLLGITISMMNQKIKEVGIRKIHGASSSQILWMVNWQFAKLIVAALTVGLPIAYLIMSDWVAEFPYQTNLGVLPFASSVLVLIGVALITTTLVVLKVAATNPAEALRNE